MQVIRTGAPLLRTLAIHSREYDINPWSLPDDVENQARTIASIVVIIGGIPRDRTMDAQFNATALENIRDSHP